MAILINDVWHSAVIDGGGCAWSYWKGDVEEREKSWNKLEWVVDGIGNG